MRRIVIAMSFFCSLLTGVNAQKVLVKNNLLYDITTTPNIGVEFRLTPQTSLSLHTGYNPFKFPSKKNSEDVRINTKLKHWVVMPEYKYWFCKTFERGYVGLHGIYGQYNVGGIGNTSSSFFSLKDYRYKGYAYGGGLSYGYQWAIGGRWGLEASLGGGFLHLEYDKYNCGECEESLGRFSRNYFGITKASVAIVFFIQ